MKIIRFIIRFIAYLLLAPTYGVVRFFVWLVRNVREGFTPKDKRQAIDSSYAERKRNREARKAASSQTWLGLYGVACDIDAVAAWCGRKVANFFGAIIAVVVMPFRGTKAEQA